MLKISALKSNSKFVTHTQALICGDFRNVSVVQYIPTPPDLVVDSELVIYDPMVLTQGHFFLTYYKLMYHKAVKTMVKNMLSGYCNRWTFCGVHFVRNLWTCKITHWKTVPVEVFEDRNSMKFVQEVFRKEQFVDNFGFAETKLLVR